jgi:serine/threonine protein kinase
MPRDDDQSLGEQQTYEGGAQPADSSDRSLGDQSTFGGGGESSLSDIGGLTGDADLDMEIVDLSRYEVQETLGKGGMGEVLLATDTRLNRKVAIKRMLGDATKSQTAVQRFLTEAQSIAALNHFNIVQIHDYGRDQDGPFLIMEYVEGGSLLDKCREGALPLEEAVDLTCQLCDGLIKAHDAGIIHRDIKPANILLTTDGVPKLTDFGLARQDTGESGMTLTGAVLGTPDFMSPEQRRDATLTDARSDQWSLAATVYQMVTGKSPKVIRMDTVPTALQPVLIKALEEEQDDRYRSLKDFRGALRQVVEERTTADDTLTEDVCPSCKRLVDSDRAFCLNCGTSLNASCLSCGSTFRCWGHACGHCGAGQSTLLETRHREIGAQRDLAVELLKKNDFVAAESIAKTCCEMQEWRFRRWNVWGRKFKQEVARQKHDANQRCVTILQEATVHEMSGRYDQCLTVLEQVPHALRSLRMSEALETTADMAVRLQKKNAAAIRLQSTIDEQMSTGHYVGMSTLIHELCDIAPERNDAALTRLARQVRGMEETADEVLMEFSAFRRQSRFASALKTARRLPQEFLTREFVVMQATVKYEAELREQALAGLSEARLSMTPPGPLNVIYRMTLTRWCVREAPSTTDALSAFRSDRFAVPFVDECIPVREYNATLTAESITDTEFTTQIDETETFLTDLRDQARRSVRWLPPVVVCCLAIILGAGFKQIDDLSKTSELQAAVLAEQWDDVLELDRTHVQALIGRARRTLAEESPDFDSVFSDLWYAEYYQPNSTDLAKTRVSALCVRAIFHAQRDQLSAARDDLKNAQRLDADHIRLDTARTAVAELCLVRAQANLNRGNSDAAITFCNESEKYGMVPARTEPIRRKAQQMPGNR